MCLIPFASMASQTPQRVNGTLPGTPACDSGLTHGRYLPRLLRVVVNGTDSGREQVLLQRPCGALLARAADLEGLRIKTPRKPHVTINGESYLNLNAYQGLRFTLDENQQRLSIEGEPWIFYPTVLDLQPPPQPVAPPAPLGAFLNYGLFASGANDNSARRYNANAGLGVFGSQGVLLSDWLFSQFGDAQQTYRVGTTFIRDMPERVATLRLGDVVARGGAFGGGGGLGGVQYGTNFAVRPGLIITPVQMMQAATRSTAAVNLYTSDLDDPERVSRAVFLSGLAAAPHGPVELINIPTYNNGQYELVLRDRFGREVSVTQESFFNQGLLRQGLHDYSYEAGALRRSFLNDSYGGGYLAGTHRYGFSNRFTAEAHAEAAEAAYAAGLTGAWAVPYVGVAVATFAGSQSDAAGAGVLAALSVENRYLRYAYALREECRDENFRLPTETVPGNLACQTFASLSGTLPWNDGVALSASHTDRRSATDVLAVRVSYSARFLNRASLQLYGGWTDAGRRSFNTGLYFSLSFAGTYTQTAPGGLFDARRTHADVTASDSDGQTRVFGRLRTSTGSSDNTVGVQVGAALDGRNQQTLSGTWSGNRASAVAVLSSTEGTEVYSVGAASALAWMDGAWFASRPLYSSFALVRLGEDYGRVRVNGLRSDDNGDVLVTPLQPYYENAIRINPADLPASARMETSLSSVRPRFRSGAVLRPGIRAVREALLTVELLDEQGQRVPLPPGGYATVPGSDERFPVGEDGLLYVSGLAQSSQITVRYREQECRIALSLPAKPPANTIPELGIFLCEGVTP